MTNEASDSLVQYGLTTSYTGGDSGVVWNPDERLTNHSMTIDLSPGKVYHFRVKSKDAAGNQGVSDDYTFTRVVATPEPVGQITITAPMGGEIFAKGSRHLVTWNTSPATTTGKISIDLWQYNSGRDILITPIVSNVLNTNSYNWTVPTDYSGSSFSLHIGNLPSYAYVISGLFSIVQATTTASLNSNTQNLANLSQSLRQAQDILLRLLRGL